MIVRILRILIVFLVVSFLILKVFEKKIVNYVLEKNAIYLLESGVTGQYLAAEHSFKNKDFDKASEYYLKISKENPQDLFLQKRAYNSLLYSGEVESSISILRIVSQLEVDNLAANLILAIDDIKQKRFADALDKVAKANSLSKENDKSLINILTLNNIAIWANVGLKNTDEAIKLLEESEDSLFKNLQKAMVFELSNKKQDATIQYEKITKIKKPVFHFTKLAGNFFHRNDNKQIAFDIYNNYQKHHPEFEYFNYSLKNIEENITPEPLIKDESDALALSLKEIAKVLYQNKLYNEALIYLRLSEYLDAENGQTKILIANYFEHHEKYQVANEIYKQINENSNLYVSSQISYAVNLHKMNEKQATYDLLIKIHQEHNSLKALKALGYLYMEDYKYEDSIKIYSRIINNKEKISKSDWRLFYTRAISYDKSRNWRASEEDLLKSLELNPNQPDSLNYLGYSWIEKGLHIDRAAELIKKALKISPDSPQILDSMGWAYYKKGNYQEALNYIENAVSLMSDDITLNDHLGDVYWQLNRKREARFQWKKALNIIKEKDEFDSEKIKKLKNKINNGID